MPRSADDFIESYRLCVIQHALKVIGRFIFLERKGKTGYAAYHPISRWRRRAGCSRSEPDFPTPARAPLPRNTGVAMKALVLSAGYGERLRPANG